MPKILIVDDEAVYRKILVRHFTKLGITAVAFSTVEEATLELLKDREITHILSDVDVGRGHGADFYEDIRDILVTRHIRFVAISMMENPTDGGRFARHGVPIFFKKQLSAFDELLKLLGLESQLD